MAASRRHLTSRYAEGLDRFLWDSDQTLQSDRAAIEAVVVASLNPPDMTAPDLIAALVLVRVAAHELGQLEARLLTAAERAGVSRAALAAIIPGVRRP